MNQIKRIMLVFNQEIVCFWPMIKRIKMMQLKKVMNKIKEMKMILRMSQMIVKAIILLKLTQKLNQNKRPKIRVN